MSIKYRKGQGTSASDFTDLVVKVGDTLPIGTEVDYDGQTVPAGWQEVSETNLGDVVVESIRTKNLLNNYLETTAKNSVTATRQSDGTITLSGTASALTTFEIGNITIKNGSTYILSGSTINTNSSVRLDVRPSGGGSIYNNWTTSSDGTNPYTATENKTVYAYIRIASGYNCNNLQIKPMIELGSTATEYSQHQELDNKDIYSTDEQKIGIWIDGKPLYRKCYSTTTPSVTSDTSLVDVTSLNIANITKLDTYIQAGEYIYGNYYYANNNYGCVYYNIYNKQIRTVQTKYNDKTIYVIVEYTKTTD